jgi:hypothetical protein
MDNDKSILEKIADTVKDIANIAAEAADHALKAEEPHRKADATAAAYVPLAADGLVSDPMVAPVAVAPVRKRKRAAAKPTANKATKKTARKSVKKSAGKAGRKSAAERSRTAVKKTAGNANRRSANKAAKKTRKAKRRS